MQNYGYGVKFMKDSYISRFGLQISSRFYDYVRDELCNGSKVAPSAVWRLLGSLVNEYADRNAELLSKRDLLQQRIDNWLRQDAEPTDSSQTEFLRDIGYLLPEGEDYKVSTKGVDRELKVAGPQLVVPADNARYLLNAVNARWGSLRKALGDGDVASGDERDLMCMWLDKFFPLDRGCWSDVTAIRLAEGRLLLSLGYSGSTVLRDKLAIVGWQGATDALDSALLVHNGLHAEVCIKGGAVSDVALESAPTVIVDFEDAVASADMDDKIVAYRNWDGLMRRRLSTTVRGVVRTVNPDRTWNTEWGKVTLPGRALMLVRNVGMHRDCQGITTTDGEAVPEAFVDLVISVVSALRGRGYNSRQGSIYIVKPKLHGPEEVAYTVELFAAVEQALSLPPNTLKIGIMDEERRTSLNLKQSLYPARDRLFFINTGFLDRTGDEIRTSTYAGPMITKKDMRTAAWYKAYEVSNVATGLDCAVPQIGKGMWDRPGDMKALLHEKIAHPESGANCAWVPSPMAATLHSVHYHQVDVAQVRRELQAADASGRLSLPLLQGKLSEDERQSEIADSAQRVIGYVARWVCMGLGCSGVADRHGITRMEDLATLRISSQQLANWMLHGLCSEEELSAAFKIAAEQIDQHNQGQPGYEPILPNPDSSLAFQASVQLVRRALQTPNGYVEQTLQTHRRKFKEQHKPEPVAVVPRQEPSIGTLESYWLAMRGKTVATATAHNQQL